MSISARLSACILKLFKWQVFNHIPAHINKCVVVIAPHTSNLDFIIGRLAFSALGLNVRFLIKREFFFFPLGPLLKWLGGVPVDRQAGREAFSFARELFDSHKSIFLTVTPEGTRKYTAKWKKGFYIIARRAEVPIVLGVLDYKNKRGGLETVLEMSGDYDADFRQIESFYRGSHARHPEKFNLTEPEK
ncbi:MAG: 1-acyl-sn-glycerol-3-phosphate acyltransferase [Bacteroidales bacterium]|nr:1-acyl-sn-glycerol-3-phosphate acyltransferase [Bacteroidales bacterium]